MEKKNPIIDIEINNTNYDSIGFFKNFKGKKSQNIYKWRNYSFKFTRMEREYNFPKILENKSNITINKNCGKDNLGNNLYFEGECPINYIEITNNPYPSLKNYENYNWKNISIDNYYLFYLFRLFLPGVLPAFRPASSYSSGRPSSRPHPCRS